MKGRILYRNLGEKIFIARRKRKMTQERLSVLTDVDRTYISQIEHGTRNPSFHILAKLSRELKINVNELIPKKIDKS